MPKSKIDETLKKMAAGTPKATTPISSSIETLGDPDCPHCHGLGYVRRDVEPGSPDFGRLEICTCRQGAVTRQVRDRLFSLSHLEELNHLTFDSFDIRGHRERQLTKREMNSLAPAKERAENYARSLNQGRWLILMGPTGCGKTHLAAAIANFAVGIGVPTLFLTVPDLLDLLRFSFDAEDVTFEQRFEQIRTAALLVLDDFGTQNATAWAQEKLFQIVNYRYINRLPTIITTNIPFEELEERIRSRLQDAELVEKVLLEAPDYRRPQGARGHAKFFPLEFLRNRTFESFSLRKTENLSDEGVQSLEKAFNAARHYAENPEGWLVFIGTFGCGKTHLAAAIANYREDLGDPPLFVTAPDLLDHLRATFGPNSQVAFDRLFDEVRNSRLLILDDLRTKSMSPWVQEKLYQLINHRYNANIPTVITSSDEFEDMDARIRSRMLDARLCTIYAITVPAYHGGRARKTRQ
jgi:DNA replication protein DnaC